MVRREMSFEELFNVPEVEAPSAEPAVEQTPWWGPPRDELGVAVAENAVLAQSPDAVVALSHVVVFSTGVGFQFLATVRGLKQAAANRLFHEQHSWGEDELPDGFIRLGVEFSDGRRASNIEWLRGYQRLTQGEEDPEGPVLWHYGGGGTSGGSSDRVEVHTGFWMWPLPTPGALTLFCEWPAAQIPLARATIDADELRAAAQQPRLLWPAGT
jgi:hypothetical protein